MLPTVSERPSIAFFRSCVVSRETAKVLTRLQDDATVQLAFRDCRHVLSHAGDSLRTLPHMPFEDKRSGCCCEQRQHESGDSPPVGTGELPRLITRNGDREVQLWNG